MKKQTDIKNYDIFCVKDLNQIRNLIYDFDKVFIPTLSQRILSLDVYAEKLWENAIVYVAICKKVLGFIAFYANDSNMKTAYLTQIAVKPTAQNSKIGKSLLDVCINVSRNKGMIKLKLEVMNTNKIAINFYKKIGFEFCGKADINSKYMIKKI